MPNTCHSSLSYQPVFHPLTINYAPRTLILHWPGEDEALEIKSHAKIDSKNNNSHSSQIEHARQRPSHKAAKNYILPVETQV
jgi:hypothetical protein